MFWCVVSLSIFTRCLYFDLPNWLDKIQHNSLKYSAILNTKISNEIYIFQSLKKIQVVINPYTLTTVCIFPLLFFIQFLWCWQGENNLTIKSFFSWWSFPLLCDCGVTLSGGIRYLSLFAVEGLWNDKIK